MKAVSILLIAVSTLLFVQCKNKPKETIELRYNTSLEIQKLNNSLDSVLKNLNSILKNIDYYKNQTECTFEMERLNKSLNSILKNIDDHENLTEYYKNKNDTIRKGFYTEFGYIMNKDPNYGVGETHFIVRGNYKGNKLNYTVYIHYTILYGSLQGKLFDMPMPIIFEDLIDIMQTEEIEDYWDALVNVGVFPYHRDTEEIFDVGVAIQLTFYDYIGSYRLSYSSEWDLIEWEKYEE